ncbi:MAG TPA: cupin domain-containing protein [Steroidobacteraceae bacterium]|nr:cupin domain-containing protein [Steroidobacteraceae bacterium]
MALTRPALDPMSVEPVSKTLYPEPYRSRVMPREKRRLAEALGLRKLGINRTTLLPGKESSMRHWHTREDEFIYVLEGEVVLRTEAGEQLLTAGSCAGFPSGVEDGHQLINRSGRPAVYLEISNKDIEDTTYYPDPDVDMIASPPHARGRFTRRDGTPI